MSILHQKPDVEVITTIEDHDVNADLESAFHLVDMDTRLLAVQYSLEAGNPLQRIMDFLVKIFRTSMEKVDEIVKGSTRDLKGLSTMMTNIRSNATKNVEALKGEDEAAKRKATADIFAVIKQIHEESRLTEWSLVNDLKTASAACDIVEDLSKNISAPALDEAVKLMGALEGNKDEAAIQSTIADIRKKIDQSCLRLAAKVKDTITIESLDAFTKGLTEKAKKADEEIKTPENALKFHAHLETKFTPPSEAEINGLLGDYEKAMFSIKAIKSKTDDLKRRVDRSKDDTKVPSSIAGELKFIATATTNIAKVPEFYRKQLVKQINDYVRCCKFAAAMQVYKESALKIPDYKQLEEIVNAREHIGVPPQGTEDKKE